MTALFRNFIAPNVLAYRARYPLITLKVDLMFTRRCFVAGLGALVLPISAGAHAAEAAAYSAPAFKAAQAAGRPILIEITAPWCPTCKAQKPILSRLLQRPAFKDMAVFLVDFDSEQDVVRAFGATMQSTLIVFKGDKPIGRSVGDTRASGIEALLAKAI